MNEVVDFPWRQKLQVSKTGIAYPDERNIKIALENAPEVADAFRYDEFSDRIEVLRPLPGEKAEPDDTLFRDWTPVALVDEHLTRLAIWLSSLDFKGVRPGVIHSVVVLLAKDRPYHPVRSYLDECQQVWDGRKRLHAWLEDYLGAKAEQDYLEDVGTKFLIGAVARIYAPGCQMDSILVLEGAQGEGKTRTAQALGKGQWTREITGNLGDKDAAINLQSVWIAELAELAAVRRSEQEAVKAFISKRVDHYRPPYGRNSVDRARHTVFIATTNENDYLQDATGGRRFWPVDCREIRLQALERDVDQLWGEAVSRYKAKEAWHLDRPGAARARKEQDWRRRETLIDEDVQEYADRLVREGIYIIDMRVLLSECFSITTREERLKSGHISQQVSRALIATGLWRRMKPTGRGENRRQCYEYIGSKASQVTSHKPAYEAELGVRTDLPKNEPEDDIPF